MPWPVRVAALVMGCLGLAAVVMAFAEAFATQLLRPIVGIGGAIVLLAYGLFLGWVAQGLWRGRLRAQAPAIATSLLHLPVAWSFTGGLQADTAWVLAVGLVLAAVSLLVIVCLVLPVSMRALGRVRAASD